LGYPERTAGVAKKLNWSESLRLDFDPPDVERFPALALGWEVARAGGTAGAVLNAANEAAVAGFLVGDIDFCDIVPACKSVLDHHQFDPQPTLEQLLQLDLWARQEVLRWVCT
jgi:1-deoxy-D-xylulose-5-phosphate reductoisomerase